MLCRSERNGEPMAGCLLTSGLRRVLVWKNGFKTLIHRLGAQRRVQTPSVRVRAGTCMYVQGKGRAGDVTLHRGRLGISWGLFVGKARRGCLQASQLAQERCEKSDNPRNTQQSTQVWPP